MSVRSLLPRGKEMARGRIWRKASARVGRRAKELATITSEMHRSAPRGGKSINRYGERRSAPGEVPAMETGTLFALIQQYQHEGLRATVVVNYKKLEFGEALVEPRPLAGPAVRAFKASVRS